MTQHSYQSPSPVKAFDDQLNSLQSLAELQRGLRLGLRAVWLGLGGALLGWGLHRLVGWFPEWWQWILLGLGFALLPVIGFLRSLISRREWVWRLDRRFNLDQQASTALEVAEKPALSPFEEALVADVHTSLRPLQGRILRKGWFLERDMLSVVIVGLLSLMVLSSRLIPSYPDINLGTPPPLPETGAQPAQQQNQPQPPPQAGSPGRNDPEQPSSPSGGPGQGQQQPTGQNPGAVEDALQNLGSALSQEAPTYDLGQALENKDFGKAASELEALTDQLDSLSPEGREKLAEALREASKDAAEAGDPGLAEDLTQAAEATKDPASGPQAMDKLAGDLRQMEGNQQAGAGGGTGGSTGQTGSPEPSARLSGEGGDLELPLEDSSKPGSLSQASPQGGGDKTVGGTQDAQAQGDSSTSSSPLVPNTFLWKWRDVVSSYFRR